jgi:ABC-type antimicrobial peptide transport system permease subunit
MALGASARRIVLMIVGRAGTLTAIGIACGIGLSVATSRLLAALLFDVGPSDPATVAAVALVVGAAGVSAAYLPARRAARLDPLNAIRGG